MCKERKKKNRQTQAEADRQHILATYQTKVHQFDSFPLRSDKEFTKNFNFKSSKKNYDENYNNDQHSNSSNNRITITPIIIRTQISITIGERTKNPN